MLLSELDIRGISVQTIGKLNTKGYRTLEDVLKQPWKEFVEEGAIAAGIGPDKVVKIYAKGGIKLNKLEVEEYMDNFSKEKVNPQAVKMEAKTNTVKINPAPSTSQQKELLDKLKAQGVDINQMAENGSDMVSMKLNGKIITVNKQVQSYKRTEDFREFATQPLQTSDYEKMKDDILKVASEASETGARTHVKAWINSINDGSMSYDAQQFNSYDYIQPILTTMLDKLIINAQQDRVQGDILGDSEYKLYKIYVDAMGSNWDGTSKEGPLGINDEAEFKSRMVKRAGSLSPDIVERVWAGYVTGTGLLLAGDPGSGKTYCAKAVGNSITDGYWSSVPFSRVDIHAGIEPEDLIGAWDYQGQILAMSASKIQLESQKAVSDADVEALRSNLYQEKYFVYGPVALAMIVGIPILVDEVNRAGPEVQNMLLQVVDEGELNIMHIGRIKANAGFFVMFTINEDDIGTNPLSEAFLRRVKYIAFDTPDNYTKFIPGEYPNFNKTLLKQIEAIRARLAKEIEGKIDPSTVSRWAQELVAMYGADVVLDKEKVRATLGSIIKNKDDMQIAKQKIEQIMNDLNIPDGPVMPTASKDAIDKFMEENIVPIDPALLTKAKSQFKSTGDYEKFIMELKNKYEQDELSWLYLNEVKGIVDKVMGGSYADNDYKYVVTNVERFIAKVDKGHNNKEYLAQIIAVQAEKLETIMNWIGIDPTEYLTNGSSTAQPASTVSTSQGIISANDLNLGNCDVSNYPKDLNSFRQYVPGGFDVLDNKLSVTDLAIFTVYGQSKSSLNFNRDWNSQKNRDEFNSMYKTAFAQHSSDLMKASGHKVIKDYLIHNIIKKFVVSTLEELVKQQMGNTASTTGAPQMTGTQQMNAQAFNLFPQQSASYQKDWDDFQKSNKNAYFVISNLSTPHLKLFTRFGQTANGGFNASWNSNSSVAEFNKHSQEFNDIVDAYVKNGNYSLALDYLVHNIIKTTSASAINGLVQSKGVGVSTPSSQPSSTPASSGSSSSGKMNVEQFLLTCSEEILATFYQEDSFETRGSVSGTLNTFRKASNPKQAIVNSILDDDGNDRSKDFIAQMNYYIGTKNMTTAELAKLLGTTEANVRAVLN